MSRIFQPGNLSGNNDPLNLVAAFPKRLNNLGPNLALLEYKGRKDCGRKNSLAAPLCPRRFGIVYYEKDEDVAAGPGNNPEFSLLRYSGRTVFLWFDAQSPSPPTSRRSGRLLHNFINRFHLLQYLQPWPPA